jgi:hypothetical protein
MASSLEKMHIGRFNLRRLTVALAPHPSPLPWEREPVTCIGRECRVAALELAAQPPSSFAAITRAQAVAPFSAAGGGRSISSSRPPPASNARPRMSMTKRLLISSHRLI